VSRDVLAAIDLAIEDWAVSEDAMRSAPDLPKRATAIIKIEVQTHWPDGCPEPPWIDLTQWLACIDRPTP
jgi:hypothetical protein